MRGSQWTMGIGHRLAERAASRQLQFVIYIRAMAGDLRNEADTYCLRDECESLEFGHECEACVLPLGPTMAVRPGGMHGGRPRSSRRPASPMVLRASTPNDDTTDVGAT